MPTDAFGGRFRVVDQIGAGASGPLFRAYDETHDRIVAVKLFTLDLAPARLSQLVAEFERLIDAPLNHPTIVKPLATGTYGPAAYLVQEHVAAESLNLMLSRHWRMPITDTLRIAAELAGALDFAAVVGLHHGALHPGDVFPCGGETRMTGLGIAPALERVGAGVPLRRPYTIPHRGGDSASDRRTDLFALAAVVHELLYGRPLAAAPQSVDESACEIPHGAVGRVFARLLRDRPDDGFDTALAFVEALMNACSAFPASASRPTADEAPTAAALFVRPEPVVTPRRTPAAVWSVSLALIVGLAAAAGIGYGIHEPDRAQSLGPPPHADVQPPTAPANDDRGGPSEGPTATSGTRQAPSGSLDHAGNQVLRHKVSPIESDSDGSMLFVDSQPRGATLFIDDKFIGTTPLAVSSITSGEHAVRLEVDGYQVWSSPVRVRSNHLNRVLVTLDR